MAAKEANAGRRKQYGLKDRTKNGFVQSSLCNANRDSIPWNDAEKCERFSATGSEIMLL